MRDQYKPFLTEGHKDEDAAAKAISDTIGGKVYRTPEKIDMECHTDLFWETPKGELCSIDKKMRKRTSRHDSSYDDNATWVELRDNAGFEGSAYCQAEKLRSQGYDISDEHDYMMFETKDSYLFVQRMRLEPFVWNLIDGKNVVFENPKETNIPYQRAKYGNLDLCVLVSFEDLEKIMQFKIKKNVD